MEESFEDYLREARNEFLRIIELQVWNTNLRCVAEDFLIAFDQAREKALKYDELKQLIIDINNKYKNK